VCGPALSLVCHQGQRTRRAPVRPEHLTEMIRALNPRNATHGTPRGRDKAQIGEQPGLTRDGLL